MNPVRNRGRRFFDVESEARPRPISNGMKLRLPGQGRGNRGSALLPLLIVVAGVVAGGIVVEYVPSDNVLTQIAATNAVLESTVPASGENGSCQKKYKECMSRARSLRALEVCEDQWKQCVTKKCDKKFIGAGGAERAYCPNDSDCENSCTEAASSKKGLLSCCKGGPKHINGCRKEVDGKCNPIKTKGGQDSPGGSPGGMPNIPTPGGGDGGGAKPPSETEKKLSDDVKKYDEITKKYEDELNRIYAAGVDSDEAARQLEEARRGYVENTRAGADASKRLQDYINSDLSGSSDPSIAGGGQGPQLNEVSPNRYSGQNEMESANDVYTRPDPRYDDGPSSQNTFGDPYREGGSPTGTEFNEQGLPIPKQEKPSEYALLGEHGPEGLGKTPGSSNVFPKGDFAPGTQQRIDNLQASCNQGWCDARDFRTIDALKKQQNYDNLKVACDSGWCDARDFRTLDALRKALPNATRPPGVWEPPTKPPAKVPTPQPRPKNAPQSPPDPGPGGGGPPPSGGGGGPMPDLSSLLKGLGGGGSGGGGGPKAPAQPCSSDPNAYSQQQQQYQSSMQQYNQQLQIYNQQQERSAVYGLPAPVAPTQPSPCSGGGQAQQCPNQPPQPGVTSCPQGTWKPVYSGACVASWQCAATGAPTAQISCQPLVADIGMTIAISYSCANATGSSGTGFSTDNALSGATTSVLTDASSMVFTFGLTCIAQSQSVSSKCEVQVAKPSIVMVVNPKIVPRNTAATVGWLTSGMRSCIVSSPDMPEFTTRNASNTSVNGMATTSPLTADTRIVLECETAGGSSKSATTTINVN